MKENPHKAPNFELFGIVLEKTWAWEAGRLLLNVGLVASWLYDLGGSPPRSLFVLTCKMRLTEPTSCLCVRIM